MCVCVCVCVCDGRLPLKGRRRQGGAMVENIDVDPVTRSGPHSSLEAEKMHNNQEFEQRGEDVHRRRVRRRRNSTR